MMPLSSRSRAALGGILFCSIAFVARAPAQPSSIDALVDGEIASLVATYKQLHAAPELSHHEEKTAALVAARLRELGYTVTERVGKYDRPDWTSFGLVAVLKNGDGPTVMVRTELDALPVEEKTGLPYASRVKTKNEAGQDVSVMHACGHDVHITTLLGTAKMLSQLKDQWHGTLMLIAQPAEETIDGAKAMLDDGLYKRFPRPDYVIALHDNSEMEAGRVGYCPGYAYAAPTSVDITIRGLGGHGARPEATKDPIVVSAQVILALQTIVSREKSPLEPAVITVGSIHGGAKRNVIPDEVTLQLTIRTYNDDVRKQILSSIRRICKNTALAAGIPEDRAPIVKVIESETGPATYNDPKLTERLAGAFERSLGAPNVLKMPPVMGSEDFGNFGLDGHQIPTCMFWLGAVDPIKVEQSKKTGTPLPSLHSSQFAPLPKPTLRTGVRAMTAAVIELMKK
jgi:hippurate hydrolase